MQQCQKDIGNSFFCPQWGKQTKQSKTNQETKPANQQQQDQPKHTLKLEEDAHETQGHKQQEGQSEGTSPEPSAPPQLSSVAVPLLWLGGVASFNLLKPPSGLNPGMMKRQPKFGF